MKLGYLDGSESTIFTDDILELYPTWTKVSISIEAKDEMGYLVFYGVTSEDVEYSLVIDDIQLHDHSCVEINGLYSFTILAIGFYYFINNI